MRPTSSRPSAIVIAGLFLFGLVAAPVRAADLSIKPGDQVLRVRVATEGQLNQLLDSDLDIWSHETGIGPIDVHVSPDQRACIESANLPFTVLNDDLSAAYEREKAVHLRRVGGPFDDYMNLAAINAFINNLAATRPDLCQISRMGGSLQNRDMLVLHITGAGAGPKPGLFYHSLIHAREWITAPVVLYLANYLVTNYDSDPCVRDLVDRADFYLAPCVNPDGYSYTWTNDRLWRKNRRSNAGGSVGVDVNRNFGYQWGIDNSGSSPSGSSETYRGTGPFSEPETQVIRDFILNHPNIRAYMDYHSYSQLLMWPWGYTPILTADESTYSAVGTAMRDLIYAAHGKSYARGAINTTIYPVNGGSVDWVYGVAGRWAYTTELRDTGQYGFILPADQIIPTCEENLSAILYLSRWATAPLLLNLPDGPTTELISGRPTTIHVTVAAGQEGLTPGSAMIHYRYNPTDPFTLAPLSQESGTLYTATLPPAPCGITAEYYFSAQGSGGSTVNDPCDAPSHVYTATVNDFTTVPQPVTVNTLDTNPGWTTTGQWAYGTPTGASGDPTSGYTGPNVYGYNLAGAYPNNMSTTQYLTSTPFDCSNLAGTQLRFRRWLTLEPPSDHGNIQASHDGSTWTTIWDSAGGTVKDTFWTLQSYDISAVADGQPNVYIRWGMGPTNSLVVFGGWNIDDVEIWGVVPDPCGAIIPGDVNLDGVRDGLDIPAFTQALLDPGSATTLEQCAADLDGNCTVDLADMDLFVQTLLQ